MHCIGHYYNPDPNDSIHFTVEGQAPEEFAKYAGQASAAATICRTGCSQPQADDLAKKFGWADHYLTDVGNPLHTGREIDQITDKELGPFDTHAKYEVDYVDAYWKTTDSSGYGNFGNLVKDNDVYYPMTDPTQSIENLATFSHVYVDTLYYRIRNNPDGFKSDPTINRITQNCIRASARYTDGFAFYLRGTNSGSQRPAADFRYIVDQNDNRIVTFTDISTGTITSRQWTFPDGLSSSADSPVTKSFPSNGMKTVTLTVTNQYGSDSKSMDVPVGLNPPVTSFTYTPNGRLTIQFTEVATVDPACYPLTREWTFGDGSPISKEQNPSHTYAIPLVYPGKLLSKSLCGNTEFNMPVIVNTPIVVDYSTETVDKTVKFSDESSVTGASYSWDFSDNSPISTEQNPTHTYLNYGTYIVRLTVKDPYYNDESVIEKQITIYDPSTAVAASFTATPTYGTPPLRVQFTDTSSGNVTSWNWTFGDSAVWINTTASAQKNQNHIFSTEGIYNVTLIATNSAGSYSSVSHSITVTNTALPVITDPIPFTTSGYYIVPAGVNQINVTVFGGGGGGGGGNYDPVSQTANGGYGGNASSVIQLMSVVPGNNLSVKIGAGGTGGEGRAGQINGTPGNSGGASNVNNIVVAPGGLGGRGGVYSTTSHGNGYDGQNGYGNETIATPGSSSSGYGTGGAGGVGRGAGGGGAPGSGGGYYGGTGASGYVLITPILLPPVANFTANLTSGHAPLTIQFNDTSLNNKTRWNWSFGDKKFSDSQIRSIPIPAPVRITYP